MSISKQKRRYSCQSWNVAAKVVIYPDYSEDEFVTARESQAGSESETLETCFEHIGEQTEGIEDSLSETLVDTSKRKNQIEIENSLDSVTLINTNSKGCFSEDTSQTQTYHHNVTDYKTSSPPPEHLPETDCLSSETVLLQESDPTSETFLVDKTIYSQVDLSEKFEENLSSETLCLDEPRKEATNNNFSTTEDDSETLRETNNSSRPDSRLFQKIKERYERNTTRPLDEDTLGLKSTRRITENIIQSYPDVVLQSLTRFNIAERSPPLHANDLELPKYVEVRKEEDTNGKFTVEEEKEEKLSSSPYYKDLKKCKHKNEIETGTDGENVESIKKIEDDEKKLPNYENINNSEENKSEDLSQIIVASPRKRKQKTSVNSKAKNQSGLVKVKGEPEGGGEQHIYEEIIPCSTGAEEGLQDASIKAGFPAEHTYEELQKERTQNKFLQQIRSSLFRLWSAVTLGCGEEGLLEGSEGQGGEEEG